MSDTVMKDKQTMRPMPGGMKPGGPVGPNFDGEKIVYTEHWSHVRFGGTVMTDALVKHALGLASYGMSDAGEVFETMCHVDPSSREGWIDAWSAMAKRVQRTAEQAEGAGHNVSAASAYLRAATYWRMSLMDFDGIDDPRMVSHITASSECYEKYLALGDYPGERVEIPYEGTTLPAHVYRSPFARGNAPLLICTPGRDTFAEDTRWIYDGAIRRGYHVLTYDGPGQGAALRVQGLPFRPDWENVLALVIDYALEAIEGVDPERIACAGVSFGGFLVPRALCFEKRVKAAVVSPGTLEWSKPFSMVMAMIASMEETERPPFMNTMLKDYAWKQGVPEAEVSAELAKYDITDIVGQIGCDMLVLDGTSEVNPGKAQLLYDSLECPKTYHLFDEDSTAQCHAQMGGYATASAFILDWLDEHV